MEREVFHKWIQALRERKGLRTGSIGLWIQSPQETYSYTLLISRDGVALKEPGLRDADLVLSMTEDCFSSWIQGTLDPNALEDGALAWDGDLQLFRELGARMSHTPMKPHQRLSSLD
ncbi:MAG TPA: hypothetical protein DCE42_20915 [Myxococcales bacterium]|nr:hypothetical protein [Deltaproteobacteria bacterium]HAA57241.1 hypothetical protein [Myxococcales bacterium]